MKHSPRRLLIVEDDLGLQSQMRWCFEDIDVSLTSDRESAIAQLRRSEPQVVTLDLGLPPNPGGVTEGFAILDEILSIAPLTKVIVITGQEDRQNGVLAIAMGAYDFYQKPVEADTLNFVVERAFKLYNLEKENIELQKNKSITELEGIITGSPQMLKICRTIEKIAPTELSTLILGETGTGKELLAKAIHSLSHRPTDCFVAINCAAIPENLLESELFGYEKGAFTGATSQKIGKIERANGGTLFLDEIGDMSMPLQAKLLRFLQERVIERVGGTQEIPVDVRVVCATHRNLQELIDTGEFREDLFYRISEITINVPSLREREGDAIILSKALLKVHSEQHNKQIKGFTEEALKAIEGYHWPGNIREMQNRIKRSTIMADGKLIGIEDLDLPMSSSEDAQPLNLREVREQAETQAIHKALHSCNYNMAQTARLLGVTRPTLYNLVEKYQIAIQSES